MGFGLRATLGWCTGGCRRYKINLYDFRYSQPKPGGDPNIVLRLGRAYTTMKDVIDMWYEQVRQEWPGIQGPLWAFFGTTLYEDFRVAYGT